MVAFSFATITYLVACGSTGSGKVRAGGCVNTGPVVMWGSGEAQATWEGRNDTDHHKVCVYWKDANGNRVGGDPSVLRPGMDGGKIPPGATHYSYIGVDCKEWEMHGCPEDRSGGTIGGGASGLQAATVRADYLIGGFLLLPDDSFAFYTIDLEDFPTPTPEGADELVKSLLSGQPLPAGVSIQQLLRLVPAAGLFRQGATLEIYDDQEILSSGLVVNGENLPAQVGSRSLGGGLWRVDHWIDANHLDVDFGSDTRNHVRMAWDNGEPELQSQDIVVETTPANGGI